MEEEQENEQEENEVFISEEDSEEDDSGHTKTENLHLYFRQSWKARLGKSGIIIISLLLLFLISSFMFLILSYTTSGKYFLRDFKIALF